ncbi:MAG TPA: MerR family transcriptional regulator, partial [Ilumatobacteraceae bacterium]|nr:MerR family transcriptional regulator [Ilumatobacteraceae bacterium]
RTQGGNRRYSDIDIERLKRISDLAAEGMNLEGIRRVIALEAEVAELRSQIAELRTAHRVATEEAERRSPRRDLVPLRQHITLFRK